MTSRKHHVTVETVVDDEDSAPQTSSQQQSDYNPDFGTRRSRRAPSDAEEGLGWKQVENLEERERAEREANPGEERENAMKTAEIMREHMSNE